jgi:hypothetical protein
MLALARLIIGTPWMLTAAAIVLAATLGFAKGWSIEHDAKVAALATQDASWKQAIEKANRDAENDTNARVQAAADASAAVVPTPAGIDAIIRLCHNDANCRDQHQQNVKSGSLPRAQAGVVVNH